MGEESLDKDQITTVSNADEHKYLGDYIPAAQIGQNAISSAMIVIGEKGDGLSLQLNNINYITEQMYGNALSTAGDRKSTRLNSSHVAISYAVFCLKKKKQ